MNVNNKACEISFELDYPIEIAREGSLDMVSSILFRKPNRQTGPLFQNLISQFNRAMTKNMMEMKSLASEEDMEEAQKIAASKKEEADATPIMKSILEVTIEEVMEEVEGMSAMATSMDFDFEKGFKLFEKMLLSSDKRHVICEVGEKKLTDAMLDKINYQDHMKMLLVYLAFFGKPVKSGMTKDSDKQPESASPVKEV